MRPLVPVLVMSVDVEVVCPGPCIAIEPGEGFLDLKILKMRFILLMIVDSQTSKKDLPDSSDNMSHGGEPRDSLS